MCFAAWQGVTRRSVRVLRRARARHGCRRVRVNSVSWACPQQRARRVMLLGVEFLHKRFFGCSARTSPRSSPRPGRWGPVARSVRPVTGRVAASGRVTRASLYSEVTAKRFYDSVCPTPCSPSSLDGIRWPWDSVPLIRAVGLRGSERPRDPLTTLRDCFKRERSFELGVRRRGPAGTSHGVSGSGHRSSTTVFRFKNVCGLVPVGFVWKE